MIPPATRSTESAMHEGVSPRAPTVCLIGCGPGGMFFLHALETRRKELREQGDVEGLAKLPHVRCFERADGPGGVWRAKRNHGTATCYSHYDHHTVPDEEEEKKSMEMLETMAKNKEALESEQEITNMYEALWTNGAKENMEFFDYPFYEHFGRQLPVYLPRAAVLEYMIARVTRNCPTIFQDHVDFRTSVDRCTYDHETNKFEVVVTNQATGVSEMCHFDKCIWAAGDNGKQKLPTKLIDKLREDGFRGRMIHSSDTSNFEQDVRGKKILLVGGGYSAEDLALVACKTGADMVYVASRSESNVVTWTSHWPNDKVEVFEEATPVGASEDGRCIEIATMEEISPGKFAVVGKRTKLHDIDTIIFCTGYVSNTDMLEEKLSIAFYKEDELLPRCAIPDDWKMKENPMTKIAGDVPLGDIQYYQSHQYYRDVYWNALVENPSMMFLNGDFNDFPLLAIDVVAWLFLNLLTGEIELPGSADDMRRLNDERVLYEITNFAKIRFTADSNYYRTLYDSYVDCEEHNKAWVDIGSEVTKYDILSLGKLMKDAKYPVQLGTPEDGFTEKGKLFLHNATESDCHRWFEPRDDGELEWRTFRDIDNAHEFKSLWTGTTAVPLKKRWMDIDANETTMF